MPTDDVTIASEFQSYQINKLPSEMHNNWHFSEWFALNCLKVAWVFATTKENNTSSTPVKVAYEVATFRANKWHILLEFL